MPNFSPVCAQRLVTCDARLQLIFNEVVKDFDCVIIEGHRGKEAQDKAVAEGRSKELWPHGKHNAEPSKAVDAAPSPVDWNDQQRFIYFAGFVIGVASKLGIKIRWGGDWSGKHDPSHNAFKDLGHFELVD